MPKKSKHTQAHIGIFGRRNVGKSSLINLLTGQETAIVSELPGTTTDPVKKSVEIFGIGAAVLIDTAGIDDADTLGELRVQKTRQMIPQIDAAVLVISENMFGAFEENLIETFRTYKTPFFVLHNKSEQMPASDKLQKHIKEKYQKTLIDFSVKNKPDVEIITKEIKHILPETTFSKPSLFAGIVRPKDIVLLITPIDSEAPEGRMILPQVMAWRHLMDENCLCISLKDTELEHFMKLGITPDLVVTDSQVFHYVAGIISEEIPLTSFSILLARQKGNFQKYIHGAAKISSLQDNDTVLILESCTHQVSCEDIGRIKIPAWVSRFSQKNIEFEIIAGLSDIKKPIENYALVIQCGGCVVTEKQLQNRLQPFIDAQIPVTNYGMAIAATNGIFDRVIAPFLDR